MFAHRSLLRENICRTLLSLVCLAWVFGFTSLACAAGQPPGTEAAADTAAAREPAANRLIVATHPVAPFVMRDENGELTGITIDLLEALRPSLRGEGEPPVQLVYREMTVGEMFQAVEEGKVDLAAGALTVTLDRERHVDFSHPYFDSGLGIAVVAENESGWRHVVRQLATPEVLSVIGTLCVLLVISGFVICLVERRTNHEQFGGGWAKGIGSGIWWSMVTLTTVGYGDKAPRTGLGRMLAIFWMIAGIVVFSTVTAAIASALTVHQLQTRITGIHDLAGARVMTVNDSTSELFLRRLKIRTRTTDDVSNAVAALARGEIDAVVYDAPVLRYLIKQRSDSNDLIVLKKTFEQEEYAIALPSGDPLAERINRGILRVTSESMWKDTLGYYLGQ